MNTNRNHVRLLLTVVSTALLSTTLLLSSCKGTANHNGTDDTDTDSLATCISDDTMKSLAEALPKYSAVYSFHEGLALVCDKKTELWGFINTSGQEVIPCQYLYSGEVFHDGVAIVMPDQQTTICIDRKGNKLCEIPHIYMGAGFHDGRLTIIAASDVSEDGVFPMSGDMIVFGYLGLMDKEGNIIVQPDTYEVPLGEGPIITDFSEGLCRTWKGGRLCYIDTNGNEIDASKFNSGGDFSDGMAWVWNEEWRVGYIDRTGKLAIPCKYDGGGQFSEDHAFVEKDGKLAIIDRTGKELTPFQYDCISLYEDTEGEEMLIARFSEGLAWCAKDGKFGYVDTTGKVVVPFRYEPGRDNDNKWYDQQPVFDFHHGYAVVWDKSTGKYGFIDREGKEFFPCIFDDASSFSKEGLALVELNGQYAFINTEGQCTLDIQQ